MSSALHSKHKISLLMAEFSALGFSAFFVFWANLGLNQYQNHDV